MDSGTEVGAYRLLEQIGEGGMGAVWLAEHTRLGRRAAIKVLHPSFTTRPEIVTRFFNEARAATAIADPGIVQIFDFGNHTDGSAYIVMELLEGETLYDRLKRTGPFSVGAALRVLRQVAGSLGAAHARGIVHRDLKPENIFLVRDPEVPGGERAKILDFGIAKLVGDPSLTTNASLVIGTPAFMSPEQCRGAGQVDQRSDVYALGCVLFALLTGRGPFVAAGAGELIAMHLVNDPPRPSEIIGGIPEDVEAVVMMCLAKDPDDRYSSGSELAVVLGGLTGASGAASMAFAAVRPVRATPPAGIAHYTPVPVAGGPVTAGGMAPGLAPSPTTLSAAAGMTGEVAEPPRSRRAWVIGSVAVMAIGGGVAVLAMGGTKATTQTQTQTQMQAPPPPPPPQQAAVAPPPPAPPPTPPVTPPAPAPDPALALAQRMKDVLARFTAWTHGHAGAPCPDLAALGGDGVDPWGHPLQLTCTDQPANQIIGAISAGPDGAFGTDDDIASWQLREVAEVVRGARWKTARPVSAGHHPPPPPPPTKPPPPMFDENGIPINRR